MRRHFTQRKFHLLALRRARLISSVSLVCSTTAQITQGQPCFSLQRGSYRFFFCFFFPPFVMSEYSWALQNRCIWLHYETCIARSGSVVDRWWLWSGQKALAIWAGAPVYEKFLCVAFQAAGQKGLQTATARSSPPAWTWVDECIYSVLWNDINCMLQLSGWAGRAAVPVQTTTEIKTRTNSCERCKRKTHLTHLWSRHGVCSKAIMGTSGAKGSNFYLMRHKSWVTGFYSFLSRYMVITMIEDDWWWILDFFW